MPPSSPVSWSGVLDRVAEALRTAEAKALQAEQALTVALEAGSSSVAAAAMDRPSTVQDCLARAEQVVAAAEATCRESEEALSAWLTKLAAAHEGLAKAAAAAV